MRLDVSKIDERITKLQELRRIATDAEMAQLLSEFLLNENGAQSAPNGIAPKAMSASAAPADVRLNGDGVSDLVSGVLDNRDSLARSGTAAAWSNRKG